MKKIHFNLLGQWSLNKSDDQPRPSSTTRPENQYSKGTSISSTIPPTKTVLSPVTSKEYKFYHTDTTGHPTHYSVSDDGHQQHHKMHIDSGSPALYNTPDDVDAWHPDLPGHTKTLENYWIQSRALNTRARESSRDKSLADYLGYDEPAVSSKDATKH